MSKDSQRTKREWHSPKEVARAIRIPERTNARRVYLARTLASVYFAVRRVLNAIDVGSLNLEINAVQIVSIGAEVVKS
jgi:hypothetical protein